MNGVQSIIDGTIQNKMTDAHQRPHFQRPPVRLLVF